MNSLKNCATPVVELTPFQLSLESGSCVCRSRHATFKLTHWPNLTSQTGTADESLRLNLYPLEL
jgi:hypothetical protein